MSHLCDDPIVSNLQLERFRLAELPVAEMQAVARAAAQNEAVRARLEDLDRDSAAILEELPPRIMGASIRARLKANGRAAVPLAPSWYRGVAAALTLAVVAGALLCLQPASATLRHRRAAFEETRLKGLRPLLFVFRQTETGAEALGPGGRAAEDDVVQLVYQAAGYRYGAIVSLDGRGVTTRHLPTSGKRASELNQGAPMALPAAYRLDDAPLFEVFYLVTADRPFDVSLVEAAARKVGRTGRPVERLPLGASFAQHSLVIRKTLRMTSLLDRTESLLGEE
jgi:hypothetical protein